MATDNPLDDWAAAELAATMRPCRELTRHERAAQREESAALSELLARTVDAPEADVA